MSPAERHARLTQIHSELDEALELRAEYQRRIDALYAEKELLESECYDDECSCTDDDNNPCTSGQTF
jgi:hypothetical protein